MLMSCSLSRSIFLPALSLCLSVPLPPTFTSPCRSSGLVARCDGRLIRGLPAASGVCLPLRALLGAGEQTG